MRQATPSRKGETEMEYYKVYFTYDAETIGEDEVARAERSTI